MCYSHIPTSGWRILIKNILIIMKIKQKNHIEKKGFFFPPQKEMLIIIQVYWN